ncbi:NUDIX hydrolase [Labilibaculum euxinus]|uniref:NUDIX domain-containing protein n=1 Tax=Labilibaculum euxinus TaxID=2686357 RepID=A0A7M4D8V7_9BACT|nr:NUDIX domain-containing protein [Labilibaculum euxinus]MUP39086.1 NUDIX domain-containing protein [Labilibaculum euxinus]MVB08291.1 NUDIX domain-containing protein [Labilibaculum euxinus]
MSPTFPQKVIKYCPKCGGAEFLYKSDNSFLCENCHFHLYVNASAAVAALIVNEKGELLLAKRAVEPQKGMLDLPGGFVDVMETAEQALCREIKEELNLEISELSYFMSYPNEYVFGGLSVFTLDLAYICKIKSFKEIDANDDISGFKFYETESIPYQEIGSISMKEIVKSFVKKYKHDI